MDEANPFETSGLPHRYPDKVVLLTGAAAGIGRAAALRLAAEGATVWCADLNAEGAADTAMIVTGRGGTARSSAVDVSDPEACRTLVAECVEAFGKLDVLCNIAGIGSSRHTVDETPERFNEMMGVNALGPFVLSVAAIPHLLETNGNVMNLASTAGVIGQAYTAAYCASKHALVGLTKAMAVEYGKQGLRFNAVCPGGVKTAIVKGFQPPEGCDWKLIERQFLRTDLQTPEAVAAMIAYVCSDEAYYLNGAVLTLDGGMTTG